MFELVCRVLRRLLASPLHLPSFLSYPSLPPFLPPSLPPSLPFSPYLIKDHHKRYTRQAKARLERLLGGGVDEEVREVGPFPVDETKR